MKPDEEVYINPESLLNLPFSTFESLGWGGYCSRTSAFFWLVTLSSACFLSRQYAPRAA
jgi:hypothetical protein